MSDDKINFFIPMPRVLRDRINVAAARAGLRSDSAWCRQILTAAVEESEKRETVKQIGQKAGR